VCKSFEWVNAAIIPKFPRLNIASSVDAAPVAVGNNLDPTSRWFAKSGALGLTGRMWFGFKAPSRQPGPAPVERLQIGTRTVPLLIVRHSRARRYLLRLCPNGTARVTLPRGGTLDEARRFAERNHDWLEQQFKKLETRPQRPADWRLGSEILFRGQPVRIQSDQPGLIHFGSETLPVADTSADLRPTIEKHLRHMAAPELSEHVSRLAGLHGLQVKRVTVRNQRSRWGSCSRAGAISLNWRLILLPDFVRDYIILHELAHLRQMNHSHRFWREVERLCPGFRVAEHWLKQHRGLMHG
jgi:predicted metal-dependent hydrolase